MDNQPDTIDGVAEKAGQIYGVRKPEEKQYLANFVFSNLSLRDKKLQHSFKLIFEALAKYKKDGDWLALVDYVGTFYRVNTNFNYLG